MKKDELLKNRVQSLPPIIDESSEILILGTMPGKESLRSKEYYAAPNNSFWKIMKRLFNSNMEFKNYEEKVSCLKKHHIALWDTLQSCERESSLDSNIKEEEYNEFYTEKFNDFQAPLKVIHSSVEGQYKYDALLYIPSHLPYDY